MTKAWVHDALVSKARSMRHWLLVGRLDAGVLPVQSVSTDGFARDLSAHR